METFVKETTNYLVHDSDKKGEKPLQGLLGDAISTSTEELGPWEKKA